MDPVVRQAESDKLADAVVGEVPADRTGALGQQLHDAQVGQRIDLQAPKRARDHHPVEAGGVELFHEGRRHALLALDLFVIATQHRLKRSGRLHQGLRVDVWGQTCVFSYRVHWLLLPPFGSPSLAHSSAAE